MLDRSMHDIMELYTTWSTGSLSNHTNGCGTRYSGFLSGLFSPFRVAVVVASECQAFLALLPCISMAGL